jgi:hypothetical protein
MLVCKSAHIDSFKQSLSRKPMKTRVFFPRIRRRAFSLPSTRPLSRKMLSTAFSRSREAFLL